MKKKNIMKDVIYIVSCYISILLFYNANLITRKILFYCNDHIAYYNKTIILSLIIMSLIVIFKNILFRKKIYLWVMLLFILSCNFAEGYFYDFNVFTFIALYLYLLLMTFFICLRQKIRFELSIVYSFSILILSAFVTGLFGLLIIFKYVILIFSFYMMYYIYKKCKSDIDNVKQAMDNFYSTGFIIFNIMWILCIMFGGGLYVHTYDEYSHWAYDAKAMIYYAKFGTSQEIMLKTKAYPPIFTVWHYIVSILGGFSEHNLYVGLNMLTCIYLLPAFYYIKNNNIVIKILGFISLIYCCYIFGGVYSYTTLYVDYAITVIFTSAIIIYFIYKNENIRLNNILTILFIILTLTKTNGFVISCTLLLLIFINELVDTNNNSTKKFISNTFNIIKKYKKLLLAIILTYLFWKIYLCITDKMTVDYYNFQLLPVGLMGDLKYKLNYDFIYNFTKKVYLSFDNKYTSGLINFSLYQYLMLSFIVIYYLFYKITNSFKQSFFRLLPFVISYIAFFCVTILSMFVAMSLYEASVLASFDRYLNWYNVAILLFIIAMTLKIDNNRGFLFKLILLSYISLCIPFSTIFSFIRNPIRAESYNVSVDRNNKVKVLKKYTEPESLIYVIDQKDKDGIMAMWYTRYYGFPRKNNASSSVIGWKIKTEKNKDDLQDWGFTAHKWAKHLKKFNFDYVFLYSKDKYFFKKTKFMYENYELSKKSTLFKIKYKKNRIILDPIK